MAYKSWKPKGDNYISPKGIAFPIGMVIITATNINPTNWTYGTWQLFGQGKCLVGVDTSDSNFNTPLKTGGEKKHTLTINEMPSHNHNKNETEGAHMYPNWGDRSGWGSQALYMTGNSGDSTQYVGGGQSHNNLQPYITVYFWRRIS